jgi:catechol 2,3-dioxygenase-like lactoylglutathione lyase family enzyme
MSDPQASFVPIRGLHHYAYRCRDCEETRAFYEDVLGLPLVHVIRSDVVPSTGEHCPYVHIFFRMDDGSHLAFFDLGDNVAAEPSPNTPEWVNHIALRVDSIDALRTAKARLQAAGVEVLGITDHHIIESIYFFDPNGIRLELTVPTASAETTARHAREAHAAVQAWTREKQAHLASPRGTAAVVAGDKAGAVAAPAAGAAEVSDWGAMDA